MCEVQKEKSRAIFQKAATSHLLDKNITFRSFAKKVAITENLLWTKWANNDQKGPCGGIPSQQNCYSPLDVDSNLSSKLQISDKVQTEGNQTFE